MGREAGVRHPGPYCLRLIAAGTAEEIIDSVERVLSELKNEAPLLDGLNAGSALCDWDIKQQGEGQNSMAFGDTHLGEVGQTLAWHHAVHEAKLLKFGDQPLLGRVNLAVSLLDEEAAELKEELVSASVHLAAGREIPPTILAAAAKEAADVLFVTLQAMHTLGITFEEVYQEVLRSNWTKLEGGVRSRDDGKLLKGEHYCPADVEGVLANAARLQEAINAS